MKKGHVKLKKEDKKKLKILINQGTEKVRIIKRAMCLLALDRGETYRKAGESTGMHYVTASTLAKKYKELGLGCLKDEQRPGRPIGISGEERAKITALACSEAPEGYSQWSLRLLSDKAVELGYSQEISHTQVGRILKKTNLNHI